MAATKLKKELLEWVHEQLAGGGYDLTIQSFSKDWNDGIAFCALMHRHFPADIGPFAQLDGSTRDGRAKNFELAFSVAEKKARCQRLFDVEDMLDTYPKPDAQSIITYLCELRKRLPKPKPADAPKKAISKGPNAVIKAVTKKVGALTSSLSLSGKLSGKLTYNIYVQGPEVAADRKYFLLYL